MAQDLRTQVHTLYDAWHEEIMFLSNVTTIISNENFKKIVSLGKDATPYIIEILRDGPNILVWALNIIYNFKIGFITDNVETACKKWVKFYDETLKKDFEKK